MFDGILLIDKETGPTSHDVVAQVRRLFGQKRVGHTGTLDPAATGLLVLLLGRATRLADWMVGVDKTYTGVLALGVATDTYDADGQIIERRPCDASLELMKKVASDLCGEAEQLPPVFSAIKIAGAPAHRLARSGRAPTMKPRAVRIDSFDLGTPSGEPGFSRVPFRTSCSSGTYVRSLAVDFGARLGCPAHLAELRREAAGKFSVVEAASLSLLEDLDGEARAARILPMRDGIDLPVASIRAADLSAARNGCEVPVQDMSAKPSLLTEVALVSAEDGNLVGLGKIVLSESGATLRAKPFKVL